MTDSLVRKSSTSNRGKVAERLVKTYLKGREESSKLAYHKFADAYSGFKSPAPCDFMVMSNGKMFVIEVKETKHDFRLPKANLKPEQIARMRLWEKAGARAYVLVYHSQTKLWRLADVEWFLGLSSGSWDLSILQTYNLKTLMDSLL
jgi:penicillin-binding protein-related factor A (putative recombinase)